MFKIVAVKMLRRYQLWIRFSDGKEGEVDLSDLAGRGVFKAWEAPAIFEAVRIDESGSLVWPNDIDLCSDSLYLRLTGKSPEELFPNLRAVKTGA
ncbi:MAG: DUF2442 domain-containing protein [candidate division Zixibacteria bacterium CG_4_9_14_3_um_filter_46_8]|nr:MAG: DUF2442 domain-containing protein [candidate division Zixibacteria bacterium CG_4_9_14_3_um_filter_46_8]